MSLLVIWVVWGSTYLGIRIVVHEMPPLPAAASLRFAVAGSIMGLVALFHRPPPTAGRARRQWLDYGVVGVLLLSSATAS